MKKKKKKRGKVVVWITGGKGPYIITASLDKGIYHMREQNGISNAVAAILSFK